MEVPSDRWPARSKGLPKTDLPCVALLFSLEVAFKGLSVLAVQASRAIIHGLNHEQPEAIENFLGLSIPNPIYYSRYSLDVSGRVQARIWCG